MRSSYDRPRSDRVAALLCAAALFLGNGPEQSDTAAILAATQARYDAVEDLSARFVQTSHVASLGRDEVAHGRVWMKRPGRMRWEYESPEPLVITVDEQTVRVYAPGDGQLQIAALGSGAFSPTVLDFLLGTGDLSKEFKAERLPDADGGAVRLLLLPQREVRFHHLELQVASDTHQLRSSVLVDVLGNRTEIRFEEIVENAGVAESRFTIVVPADTEVIDLR